jgi:N-acetylneuraminic acid mutarotase
MTIARQQFGTSVINGQLYVLGGVVSGPGTVLDAVERYDPTTDAWTTVHSMPHVRYRFYSAAVGGKIYVFGGSGWTSGVGIDVSAVVDVYDPSTNSWTTISNPMPVARSDLSGAVVNGKIYLIGGQPTLTIDEYDPVMDSWVSKTATGIGNQSFAVSVSGTNIYIIGGWSDGLGTVLGKVDKYDSVNDVITEVSTLPIPVQGGTSASINGLIYVFGGSTSGGNDVISNTYQYNPATNQWLQGASMSKARYKAGSEVIDTLIYIVGGEEAVGQAENASLLEVYDQSNDYK